MKGNYAIFVLKNELKEIKKRLNSDVITDMRFSDEIQEDKEKVKQLQRSILILEKNKR